MLFNLYHSCKMKPFICQRIYNLPFEPKKTEICQWALIKSRTNISNSCPSFRTIYKKYHILYILHHLFRDKRSPLVIIIWNPFHPRIACCMHLRGLLVPRICSWMATTTVQLRQYRLFLTTATWIIMMLRFYMSLNSLRSPTVWQESCRNGQCWGRIIGRRNSSVRSSDSCRRGWR